MTGQCRDMHIKYGEHSELRRSHLDMANHRRRGYGASSSPSSHIALQRDFKTHMAALFGRSSQSSQTILPSIQLPTIRMEREQQQFSPTSSVMQAQWNVFQQSGQFLDLQICGTSTFFQSPISSNFYGQRACGRGINCSSFGLTWIV